jgi:iron complex outermembrane receptor protein
VLPPGTSIQKALNFLPGVSAQSIDALGVNEQSLSLQVRGFNTTHLGYTLDGMPLGDGAYNNYNGLTISRALISENLGRADLATGIAGLGIASTSNLGGALTYFSSDPARTRASQSSQTVGSENSLRTFVRVDTGEHGGFSAYLSGQYTQQDLFVNQGAYKKSTGKQFNGKLQYRSKAARSPPSRTSRAPTRPTTPICRRKCSAASAGIGRLCAGLAAYLGRAYCAVTAPTAPTKCVDSTLPEKSAPTSPSPTARSCATTISSTSGGDFDLAKSSASTPRAITTTTRAPATTGSPAGRTRARHPPPTTCRSRSATRATRSTAAACSAA